MNIKESSVFEILNCKQSITDKIFHLVNIVNSHRPYPKGIGVQMVKSLKKHNQSEQLNEIEFKKEKQQQTNKI